MFVACVILCLADVSSVSPSSEQTEEFMNTLVGENTTSNHQLVHSTDVRKQIYILIDLVQSLFSHDLFISSIVSTYLRIEVAVRMVMSFAFSLLRRL